MNNKKRALSIMVIVIIFCMIMAVVDGIFMADYFVKSAIKLVLFVGTPFIYQLFDKELNLKNLFIPNKKGMLIAISLCIPVYFVIFGGYLLLKDVFDFSNITTSLTENIGVTGANFIYVSLYISFINSLLEEFFFRGFAFLSLKTAVSTKTAYIFSSLIFALYHIAFMIGWFSLVVFLVVMAGLFVGGMCFNYLNSKSGNIYTSWFVHMFANFAINTIGFMLFNVAK